MYNLLNANIDWLCSKVDRNGDIGEYVWLAEALQKVDVSSDRAFQRRYRNYWRMNAAHLGEEFIQFYFSHFEGLKQQSEIRVEEVAQILVEKPTHGDGRHSLQFSFASKMVHMLRPHLPVYDSMVEAFFFLPGGTQKEDVSHKAARLLGSYAFLTAEYERVLREKLLALAINTFRKRFNLGQGYTDEKIIDTLIWKFVGFARKGAVRDGCIRYS
jgi:hypothetical protein